MTLAQTALSAGLTRLLDSLPTEFAIGAVTFTGLLSEAKPAQAAGGKIVLSGGVFYHEIVINPAEMAYTAGHIKDGATITSNSQKFCVEGRPRSYGQHKVVITVRQVK